MRKPILVIGEIIGDPECDILPWSSVPNGLHSLILYEQLIVIPEPFITELQKQLVDRLRHYLKLPGLEITITWILNEHCISDLADQLGMGSLFLHRFLPAPPI
jgi:hypothetical protein